MIFGTNGINQFPTNAFYPNPKKDIGIQKMEKTPFGQKVSVI